MNFIADTKLLKDRLEACLKCPELSKSKISSSLDKCKACGCFLELKTKLEASRCPKGRWKR